MPTTSQKHFPCSTVPNPTDSSKDVNPVAPDMLSPQDVARRLGVCTKTALQLMRELPHVCISRDMYSARKRIRITKHTLEGFINGEIERKLYEEAEEELTDVSN